MPPVCEMQHLFDCFVNEDSVYFWGKSNAGYKPSAETSRETLARSQEQARKLLSR